MRAIANTHQRAKDNEMRAFIFLARYGWLTTNQLGMLLWPTSKNQQKLAKRLLHRMHLEMLIECENLNTKGKKQYYGWYLIDRGLNQLKSAYPDIAVHGYIGEGRFSNGKYHYINLRTARHRFLANQFMIELSQGKLSNRIIPEMTYEEMEFLDYPEKLLLMPEVQIISQRNKFLTHFGCQPDALIRYDNVIISVEVENTSRGPANHGKKLYSFLDVYLQRIRLEGVYKDFFHTIPEIREFEDMFVLFVCSTQKAFRNIYRHVERKVRENKAGNTHLKIYYLVTEQKTKNESWVNPFNIFDILSHSDAEHIEEEGRERGLLEDDIRDILRDKLNGMTVSELAKNQSVTPSTIYRWNQKYKVW